jgi:hypothetical protein
MKRVMKLTGAIVGGTFAITNLLWAQDTKQVAGTLSELSPDTIALRTAASRVPVRYLSSQTTAFVDDAGVPILSIDALKAGVTVTMYYSRVADQMVASRVVVHKSTNTPPSPEATTTTAK